jgi:hypothetical protein
MSSKSPEKDQTAKPADTAQPEGDAPAAEPARTDRLEPGVYEYIHPVDCVYPHVPLTAKAARPGSPATDDGPGEPATAATVFDWPFGPPGDGRWVKTRKKPNQAPDNAPPLTAEE